MAISDNKRYKILLTRTHEPNGDCTLGKLDIIDLQGKGLPTIYTCFTLERGGNSTDEAGKAKRIVARDYELEWTDTARNGNLAKKYPKFKCANGRNKALWLTCDRVLLKFRDRRVLIHIGNYAKDSLGCILLGKWQSKAHANVSNSIECVKEFYELIEKIGAENCFLRIVEI